LRLRYKLNQQDGVPRREFLERKLFLAEANTDTESVRLHRGCRGESRRHHTHDHFVPAAVVKVGLLGGCSSSKERRITIIDRKDAPDKAWSEKSSTKTYTTALEPTRMLVGSRINEVLEMVNMTIAIVSISSLTGKVLRQTTFA